MTEQERELIDNLASAANAIMEDSGFNEDVKEIVQTIGIIKQN